MSYNRFRLVLKEFIINFVFAVSHLSGELFTIKNNFLQENNFCHRKNNFPIGSLEIPTEIKELSRIQKLI